MLLSAAIKPAYLSSTAAEKLQAGKTLPTADYPSLNADVKGFYALIGNNIILDYRQV
jgi:hypothetical protein